MRPRANTLSHVDAATIGMLANNNPAFTRHFMPGHGHSNSLSNMNPPGFSYRGMSTSNHPGIIGLPKIDTSLPTDLSSGLRTAPPFGGFGAEFSMSFPHGQGNTINPHALHMNGVQGLGLDHSGSPYQQMFYTPSMAQQMMEEEGAFDWMTHGFENQMTFTSSNENAIDDSSPSAMSTNSPAHMHDVGPDMHTASTHAHNMTNAMWQHQMTNPAHMVNSPMSMDFTSNFSEMVSAPTGTISPKSLLAQGGTGFEMSLPTPPDLANIDNTGLPGGLQYAAFQLPLSRDGGASTASTASMDSSLRHSSVTTMSSDLVSENMRNALLTGLSQNSPFGKRKPSQPLVSSPLSPESNSRTRGFNVATFPSTQDLQRYVAAYIKFFHPHLPFIHVASLNFESAEYTIPMKMVAGQPQFGSSTVAIGGCCLVLSISAIGAVYERDMNESKDLFECAKRLISSFLEERRKANLSRTQYGPRNSTEYEDTPLWLVQAMLLNVIYGHNCGDKTAAELASNHCAALVSLARGAELARPYQSYAGSRHNSYGSMTQFSQQGPGDVNGWSSMINENEEVDWLEWKTMEERKRTLYAVFILSSMLVTAYNHAPALTNSEIRLDLPCDEELWAADSPQKWQAMGGARQAEGRSVTFAAALTHLLTSSQRQRMRNGSIPQTQGQNELELRPSTFGCLVLVNALHNYIWETRQRHLGRQWTVQEKEQMHAHIEPALRAWQAAWASNPCHSLERPNPFGAGPLSADSIPLLDLAYVRLYINLGRSKEAFWHRDYDAVAEELARGADGTQDQAPAEAVKRRMSVCQVDGSEDTNGEETASPTAMKSQSTRRERQLRRAAFYAADSLLMSEKLGLSFAENLSRELPMQSALCAFDCAQVLAEWVTSVQERVGKYLGILGQHELDLMQVPGILLLEDDDRQLLAKIEEFITHAEGRIGDNSIANMTKDGGYGGRILRVAAYVLERAAVWPGTLHLPVGAVDYANASTVTKLMASSLETQAGHLMERAVASAST